MNDQEWKNDSTGTAHAIEATEQSQTMTGAARVASAVIEVMVPNTPPAPEPTPEPVVTTEELFTTKDIAALLGASYGCVRWYLDRGYITGAKHVPSGGRKTFVVKRSDLLKWLEKPGQRAKWKTLHWDRLAK
jgi:hypothetical protein